MLDALAILDADANCLISRTYTQNLLPLVEMVRSFKSLIRQNTTGVPVLSSDGIHYIFIRNNDVYILAIAYYEHVNVMTILTFLYKFNDILMSYFKTKNLSRDLIVDNFNLIYELFDEIMDYGVPQLTDTQILNDVIKLELNESKEKSEDDPFADEINSSILKTTTNAISWRPTGIFYKKNEFFVDVTERILLTVNPDKRVVRHEIHGSIDVKCYLSGMPMLRIGINKLLQEGNDKFFAKLHFHQCVELPKFTSDRLISFIPPDGKFELCNYALSIRSPPLIEVTEHEFKVIDNQILRTTISIHTNFRMGAHLEGLVIKVPINLDLYDIDFRTTPKFKTRQGKVSYKFDENVILWSIDSLSGDRSCTMMSQFRLNTPEISESKPEIGMDPPPKVTKPQFDRIKATVEDDDDITVSQYKDIRIEFELPDITLSSLKIEYLKITEDLLNYPAFPWVRYKTTNENYVYRL